MTKQKSYEVKNNLGTCMMHALFAHFYAIGHSEEATKSQETFSYVPYCRREQIFKISLQHPDFIGRIRWLPNNLGQWQCSDGQEFGQ